MKILYIHQYFTTNEGGGGTRSYDVSRYLVSNGHSVTMICGMNQRAGLHVRGIRLWKVTWIDGIKVIVLRVPYSNYMSVAARLFSFFNFSLLSILAGIKERKIDLVFASSTPLTVAIPGVVLSKFRRKPYIFEVRDLWPEDLVAAGRMKSGSIGHRIHEFLENRSYARASKVILVSKGFHDRLLERNYPDSFLETIELGADGELFENVRINKGFWKEKGLDSKTIAVYTGAHGNANGLYQILDAAEYLKNRDDIAIVMIGDGGEKPDLLKELQQRNLKNVHMFDPVIKKDLPGILAGCHIGLMILKQITRPRWVTPNKLFDYMFAGLPTLVNFEGTTAEIVEKEKIGITCKPGSAEDLAQGIQFFTDNPEKRLETGMNARRLAYQKYDRKILANKMEKTLLSVVNHNDLR